MKFTLPPIIFALLLLASFSNALAFTQKTTRKIMLGTNEVRINIYEKEGIPITFVAPHHNEEIARRLAKSYVEKNGGRFVEIESFDEKGKPSRYLRFAFRGKQYSVDPNRIFTDMGRKCSGLSGEISPIVAKFAVEFLKILLSDDSKSLRSGERFIVAVHNNNDVDAKAESLKASDLTATAFVTSHNFQKQAEGVYLSNTEDDADNFIFVSTPKYVSYFAEKGFNVVVQKSAGKLHSETCGIDDGSLSVFSAHNDIQYICLEADSVNGFSRQLEMFEAVYQLANVEKKTETQMIAIR